MFNLPYIKIESCSALKELQRGISNCLHTLMLHEVSVADWDPIIIFLCCQRLPETTIALWEQSIADKKELPKWAALNTFLTSRVLTLESIAGARQNRSASLTVNSNATKAHHTHVDVIKKSDRTKFCPLCPNQRHNVRSCGKFRGMTVSDRWNTVKGNNFCFNCLSNGHSLKDCSSTFRCATCHQQHHTLLHNPKPQRSNVNLATHSHSSTTTFTPSIHAQPFQPSESATPSQSTNQATSQQSFHQKRLQEIAQLPNKASQCVLLGTAKVKIHHRGDTFTVRALIDSGSEVSCISQTIRKRLGLPTKPANISLLGVNSQVTAQSSHICAITIGAVHDLTSKIQCSALVLPRISGNLPSVTISSLQDSKLPNFQLADPTFYQSSPIDLLIGGDLYPSIVQSGVQHNVLGGLLAQETMFGWILTGSISAGQVQGHTVSVHHTTAQIDSDLRKFWEIEEIPKKKFLTDADKYCEQLYRSTTKRNCDGRYVVTLPFKPEFASENGLGQSRNVA